MSPRSDPETPAITCQGVSREYVRGETGWFGRGRAQTVTALNNVSLRVDYGEFVGVAGPSGSGKSTLLHLLSALDTPTSGRVTLAGVDPAERSRSARARLRLDHVGIVFQRFHLLPALSARANVAVPLIEQGVPRKERRERAERLLADLDLQDRAHHKPGALSGGEQQRVAIARALATDPDVLVADEPTGELDTTTGASVLDAFERVASDRAVVLASHDTQALDRTDRVIRLRDGKRIEDTT
ncbi:ABC transporter ATP-binding protein [Haloplanus halobius]|uniref:ABC transporter ATP-binding protein n=1 Tax=Haloplanus halobius TaxID=2934938 RepID=UPI00200E742E|nr:ABC transporter ATP-binding protein [Haloplanus sp. XH21]